MSTNNITFLEPYIRWMIFRDLDEVVMIEGDTADPLQGEQIITMLRDRKNIGMVIEINDLVVGHMIYRLHKDRLELLRLAVCKHHRRCSVATLLLEKLYSKIIDGRRNRIVVNVPDWNLPMHITLKANGYIASAMMKDEYRFVKKAQRHALT
jgi:[ribosomal protein S18]-alanine N-acetyltransferase